MIIKKWRKKPVVVEAIQFKDNAETIAAISEFVTQRVLTVNYDDGVATAIIETLEGDHIAQEGDFIIKGVKGECYPCKPDIFEMTYEEV